MTVAVFEFGDYRLDCERFELTRSGRSLRLERKPMELLILLAAKNGHLVTREEIAQRLWEREVFVDTEHGINTAVRKIRQVLSDDPEQPRFLQTVTGKGYRFIGPLAAPVADPVVPASAVSPDPAPEPIAIDAPIANIAPESAQPAAHIVHNPQTVRWLSAAGAVFAIICLALAIRSVANSSRSQRALASVPKITSLAVIPLDNLSGSPAQDYIADGMTDELITMLAKNSTLRVISRTSVMQYKGVHRPLPEIARELGVDGILEGSIARSGDKIHLNIQLIQAPSDTHVWAESYDRDANDSVSLPREAAQTIAKKLNSAVPAFAPPKYVNAEAHDAYVHGMYLWYRGDPKAYDYFKKATDIQPDYALGWSGLSYFYGQAADSGAFIPREYMGKSEAAAMKALQLDDSLPQAHLALSFITLLYRYDWAQAEPEMQRAMQLDPEYGEAPHIYAKELIVVGRIQDAIAAQKKATAIDSFSRPWALAMIYVMARQYDNAIAEAKARLESLPHDDGLYWQLSEAYRCKGMQKESIEMKAKMLEEDGDRAAAEKVVHAYRQGGYKRTVLEHLAYLKHESAKHYVSFYDQALPNAELGRREETLKLLEESYRQRDPGLMWVQCEPAFDFLHADERYRAIIRGMGLPPAYQIASNDVVQ